MPGLRTITAVDNLGDVAVALTSLPVMREDGTIEFDEVWQISRSASPDQIAAECNAALVKMSAQRADMLDQCAELRTHGQRRALWLFLAVVAGVALPSPFRGLYEAYGWIHVAHAAAVAVVGALLVLAAREHRVMRRLTRG